MDSTRCILQKSMPLFAVMVMFSVLFSIFSGYGILSVFITSLLLIMSPIAFIFKKQIEGEDIVEGFKKQIEREDIVEGEAVSHICDELQDSSSLIDNQVCKTVQQAPLGQAEKSSSSEEISTDTISQQIHDLYSESESIDPSFSSEDSDNDWAYSCNYGQSPECSDDSISDEESLIEIAIPSGHYVCSKESKFTLQQKFQSYSTETFLDQHGFLEQFAKINEMNEEDNLIEIDLSMGSIKCSRFEIKA